MSFYFPISNSCHVQEPLQQASAAGPHGQATCKNPGTHLAIGCSPLCREGILSVLRASQTPELNPCWRDPVPAPRLHPRCSHLQHFRVDSGLMRDLAIPGVLWCVLQCQVCGLHPLGLSSGDGHGLASWCLPCGGGHGLFVSRTKPQLVSSGA